MTAELYVDDGFEAVVAPATVHLHGNRYHIVYLTCICAHCTHSSSQHAKQNIDSPAASSKNEGGIARIGTEARITPVPSFAIRRQPFTKNR